MASEGYAIKLRNRRKNLELAEQALERMERGDATQFDRIRHRSLEQLRARVEFERGAITIMEGY